MYMCVCVSVMFVPVKLKQIVLQVGIKLVYLMLSDSVMECFCLTHLPLVLAL